MNDDFPVLAGCGCLALLMFLAAILAFLFGIGVAIGQRLVA
jgi:hypothetical protein